MARYDFSHKIRLESIETCDSCWLLRYRNPSQQNHGLKMIEFLAMELKTILDWVCGRLLFDLLSTFKDKFIAKYLSSNRICGGEILLNQQKYLQVQWIQTF